MALPAEVFPLTVGLAAEWAAYGSLDHYNFVLDTLLAGLQAGR